MNWKSFWNSSRSTIISGVIAIAVIAGLFFLFNVLPANQPAKPANEQKKTEEKKQEEQNQTSKQNENQTNNNKNGEKKTTTKVKLPTTHKVSAGENLWNISNTYYGTGYNWTLIAKENKLANPDIIHSGNALIIPKAEAQVASSKPSQYTVVKGDSLWKIAEKYYGTGFQWTKIRDANPGKIGVLPNGRPLITPGQILKLP